MTDQIMEHVDRNIAADRTEDLSRRTKIARRVITPLAVLAVGVVGADKGVQWFRSKIGDDKAHSTSYLQNYETKTVVLKDKETAQQAVEEVDGTNLDPQTLADLEKKVTSQGLGGNKSNPALEMHQAVEVPDLSKPIPQIELPGPR